MKTNSGIIIPGEKTKVYKSAKYRRNIEPVVMNLLWGDDWQDHYIQVSQNIQDKLLSIDKTTYVDLEFCLEHIKASMLYNEPLDRQGRFITKDDLDILNIIDVNELICYINQLDSIYNKILDERGVIIGDDYLVINAGQIGYNNNTEIVVGSTYNNIVVLKDNLFPDCWSIFFVKPVFSIFRRTTGSYIKPEYKKDDRLRLGGWIFDGSIAQCDSLKQLPWAFGSTTHDNRIPTIIPGSMDLKEVVDIFSKYIEQQKDDYMLELNRINVLHHSQAQCYRPDGQTNFDIVIKELRTIK